MTTRETLLGIYMFKVNNKNIRTRYETFLKLKLKNKHTRTTLSNGVLLSLLLTFNVFLPGSSVFIVDFKHLNDGWKCCLCILTIAAVQVAANVSKSLTRDTFVFIVTFQSISKSATKLDI